MSITEQQSSQAAKLFALFGDQTRMKIFCHMLEHDDHCVSEIADALRMTVAAISYHLQLLREYDLVETQREGQTICYKLKHNQVTDHLQALISAQTI
jgi:DNA-binding transcriptional ArsR family regulator